MKFYIYNGFSWFLIGRIKAANGLVLEVWRPFSWVLDGWLNHLVAGRSMFEFVPFFEDNHWWWAIADFSAVYCLTLRFLLWFAARLIWAAPKNLISYKIDSILNCYFVIIFSEEWQLLTIRNRLWGQINLETSGWLMNRGYFIRVNVFIIFYK